MRLFFLIMAVLFAATGFSQVDSAFLLRLKRMDTANFLRLDTLTPPNDGLTRKIKELRKERKGINIGAVIQIKLLEERAKDTTRPKSFYDNLEAELTTGNSARLLENSLVNIYRRSFSLKEIKRLIRFYKTSAGRKMDDEYVLLLVQSVKDAEQIMKMAYLQLQAKR